MNKKQRLEAVKNAMRYTGEKEQADKANERAEIYIFQNDINAEVKDILMRNIYDDNIGGTHDLGYEICARACDLIANRDELSDSSFDEVDEASVYTSDRLGYLNNLNQDEISEKMKEFDCDIQEACAVWFDDMVRNVALQLKDYIANK